MARLKLNYKEGDWFMVPLQPDGFATGLVARHDARGRVLGYFFGPRRDHPPSPSDIKGLQAGDAVMVCIFGGIGLLMGKWKVIAHSENWNRDEWPIPTFGRVTAISNIGWEVKYSDTLKRSTEQRISVEMARELTPDRLCGYGSIETRLSRLLATDEPSDR